MNATGTQRQLAVLAAFRVKPEASQVEIARAAGVTASYVSHVLADYLESQAHERTGQVTVGARPKPAEADIARFAPDGRFGGNAGPAACTEKQQRLRTAMAALPRATGQSQGEYSRRIAAIAKVSPTLVIQALDMMKCESIGAARRAEEEARAKVEIAPLSLNARAIGPMPEFRGWADVFSRFKFLAEAYVKVARSRGDAFAEAFLSDLRDHADRAETRSWMDRSTQ